MLLCPPTGQISEGQPAIYSSVSKVIGKGFVPCIAFVSSNLRLNVCDRSLGMLLVAVKILKKDSSTVIWFLVLTAIKPQRR